MGYTYNSPKAPKDLATTNRNWTLTELQEKHEALFASDKKAEEDLAFLQEKRKLSIKEIRANKIGLFNYGVYTLPVISPVGEVINVRYYRRSDGKKWGVEGRNVKVIYPWNLVVNEAPPEDVPLWICEGEFDALVARSNGLYAATSIAGAASSPSVFGKYSNIIGKRKIILCFDNDDPGKKAAAQIGLDVFPHQILGMVQWPEFCKDGFDITDWVRDGHGIEELQSEYVREFDKDWAKKILNRTPKSVYFKKPDESFSLEEMWPTSGFLHDYVQYGSSLTDAPQQFHCAVGLVLLGTAINRRVRYEMGHDTIYTNFYVCLVAPSSIYRKTTSIKIGMNIIQDLNDDLIFPREFSTESFIKHLSENPRGIMAYSEIAELLDQFKRGYSEGLLSILTDFYDCPNKYTRMTNKDGMTEIEKPFINIIGASTVDWLNSNLTQEQAEGGFWPRFIFVGARTPRQLLALPPTPNQTKRKEIVDKLKSVLFLSDCIAALSPAASFRLQAWVHQQTAKSHKSSLGSGYLKYVARMQPYCIKIAMLFQISIDKGLVVSDDCMQRAIKFCDWLLTNIEYLYFYELAFSKRDAQDNKVLAVIRDHPDGISVRDLSRIFRLRRRELDETIETLILREYATRKTTKDGDIVSPCEVDKINPWE